MKLRKIGRIGVSHRSPLVGAVMEASEIGDHRQVDGRDWPAEADIRHVARSAGLILQRGHVEVVVHELAKQLYGFGAGALLCRWVARHHRRRQGAHGFERGGEDAADLALNPRRLRVQIGRQDARRVGIITVRRTLSARRLSAATW